MRSSLRVRFALLAGALVLIVATLVAVGAYLAMRDALLSRARHDARNQARQLASMVDTSRSETSGNFNQVDIHDPALTRQLPGTGVTVEVTRPDASLIQASGPVSGGRPSPLPSGLIARCIKAGTAQQRVSTRPLELACQRIGARSGSVGAVVVGAPLADTWASLATLRHALIVGVATGVLLASLLALSLARRATRPIGQIARAAERIRAGARPLQRINYQRRDELGELAAVLDASFAEQDAALERQRRFSADASHELRTPLTAMRANIELLQGWAPTDPAARQAVLASLDQASRRAVRLAEDLLYLATVEQSPSIAHAPVRLDEVVIAAMREASPLSPDVELRIACLDELVTNGDAAKLQQLLLNLLDNALRVSPSGAAVRISLRAEGGSARLSVCDEGPGFDPAQIGRVFERFHTRNEPGSRRAGSGLGLAIARAIAHDHDGELTATNRAEVGACLEFILPAAPAGGPKSARPGAGVDG